MAVETEGRVVSACLEKTQLTLAMYICIIVDQKSAVRDLQKRYHEAV